MSVSIPLQTLFANTRAGTVYQTTSAGAIEAVSAETTRTAHWVGGTPHALFEPARTNSVPNSVLAGATAGVIGSGGAMPTGMLSVNTLATSPVTEVIGTGAEFGMNYFDVQFTGTATADGQLIQLQPIGTTTIAALSGQIWTGSIYWRLVGGSFPAGAVGQIRIDERNSGGSLLASTTATVDLPVSTLSRPNATRTLINGSTAHVTVFPTVTFLNTSVVDVTIRFYQPQMELGAFATTPILTSGSAVTRAADNATCSVDTFPIDQNGGSIEIIGRAYYTTGGSGFPRVFQIDDGTNDNSVRVFVSESDNRLRIETVVGGASQSSESIVYTSGAEFHAVFVFEQDNVFLSLDGTNSTPDTTASFPTGLLTTWRWAQGPSATFNTAAVLINRIASHSHEFSTTGADAITA